MQKITKQILYIISNINNFYIIVGFLLILLSKIELRKYRVLLEHCKFINL